MNRDHSTVVHGRNLIEHLICCDPELAEDVELLRLYLRNERPENMPVAETLMEANRLAAREARLARLKEKEEIQRRDAQTIARNIQQELADKHHRYMMEEASDDDRISYLAGLYAKRPLTERLAG